MQIVNKRHKTIKKARLVNIQYRTTQLERFRITFRIILREQHEIINNNAQFRTPCNC